MLKKVALTAMLIGSVLSAEGGMEYGISLVGMKMDYREYDKLDNILDSEASQFQDITGAEVEMRYLLNESSNIEMKFLGISGDTDYTGSYLGSNSGYGSLKGTTYNKVYDFSLGYNMNNASEINNLSFLAGIGLGYRYWDRELSSIQIEEYSWYSIRGNIGVEYKADAFRGAFLVEYQYGIKPVMTATGFSSDFELSSANIIKVSLPLRYNVYENLDLTCAYVFEYQDIKESDIVYDAAGNGYVEPDSTAYNQYIKIGIVFKY